MSTLLDKLTAIKEIKQALKTRSCLNIIDAVLNKESVLLDGSKATQLKAAQLKALGKGENKHALRKLQEAIITQQIFKKTTEKTQKSEKSEKSKRLKHKR